jgi:hypothetical protein
VPSDVWFGAGGHLNSMSLCSGQLWMQRDIRMQVRLVAPPAALAKMILADLSSVWSVHEGGVPGIIILLEFPAKISKFHD